MMEEEHKKCHENQDLVSNGFVKDIKMQWPANLTILDLSNKNLANLDENLHFPPNIIELNLSSNNLLQVPTGLLNLEAIKRLDLSKNKLQYFDDYPNFCHSIEQLNLSDNKLEGPPYWVWSERPAKLIKLDISCNIHLTQSLSPSNLEELLQYKTLVKEVLIYKCRITGKDILKLLGTFSSAKSMEVGFVKLMNFGSNILCTIPCDGLDKCVEIERLNLSGTGIYNVDPNIAIYKNLVEINLSLNKISGLPNSFCDLENLEVCILSNNYIIYLPDDMAKLMKLVCLRLDSNELCMMPDNLCSLPNLRILDLYDNRLYEVSHDILNMRSIEELDFAHNFLEEPNDEEYLKKKERLRLNAEERIDERKVEISREPSEHSPSTSDDEELIEYMINSSNIEPAQDNGPPSSPEDWDSDQYWIPGYPVNRTIHPKQSPWLNFAKRMMDAGNFCPMDIHVVSAEETVRYNKLCNPKPWPVINGQFDDYPDDENRVLCLKKY